MVEQRATRRSRTYLGGRISYFGDTRSLPCIVRNRSERGALLDLSDSVALPDEVELTIACLGLRQRVRVVWRRDGRAGVAPLPAVPTNVVAFPGSRSALRPRPDGPPAGTP